MSVIISGTDGITLPDNGSLSTSIGDAITIGSTGIVTMPHQPAFSASMGASQSIPSGAGEYNLLFNVKRFDNNQDFNTSTYKFTAPVTGKYQFNASIRVDSMSTDTTYYRLRLHTSNQIYHPSLIDPGGFSGSGPNYFPMTTSVLADMDAGDEAYVTINGSGVAGGAINFNPDNTNFSGFLVC
jgi:hypothetical protein